ncbi:amino acid transporter [Salinibacter ruber]|jgi:APA family basic amino acid/polyamine antiporter|uniref:Amino acid transporter n=1 Tax=Salinibacter ruber TaxID=146919 RepID=A0A9X2PLC6_9BACT|nr:APC family permease [Salinibacter ruber]MCS3633214.1 amino acid transporter [Salinibacter ruber]MCS3639623.1 amino acid transporter [Salinibacter ruber]MCS3657361.1 amino acid transporter [Salinibacter ruber]MCS3658896.1 amino acid transporter [Salinibacter ruber]MCS3708700.1 amino acid transporter [Salinibacter ruber]
MPERSANQEELERTLGLVPALAIGTGTMVGAGIFVFPGLAAGRAGPAAMLSFAIGAVIALLVALPTSELATAMPESGGGYFFVSRALGTLLGCMVGIGQWLGLIFASAFYLIGFGHYLSDLARELGVNLPLPVVGLAFGMGILLTGVSVTGTENTGDLQNWIVGSLLAILAGFLGHGGLDALGVFGRQQTPEAFFPYGTMPVLTTAALVFTSYLGFVQIATVAGEIKAPSRNLPRSMIGSVLLVGTLYVLTIFISTSLLGSEPLAEMGETAAVNVGRSIAGTFGAAALLGGGLLATLSSANASILSASRSIYALSRDELVPSQVERINRRYRTPHVALLLTGGIIVALILFGRVEVLAEVASLLHLFMYGLICVALLVLRQSPPDGYQPSFRCPGYPVVPVLGALTSFGLVAFMNPLSIAIGGGILLATAGWYLLYARAVTISEISSS